jgi:hypothetical protein
MTAMILYRPDSDEEVLETEVLHTRQDLVSALLGKGISLKKSQFYVWLKHCEVTPSRANQYSQDDFDRLLHFAQLMKRYGEIKAAKTKFHQRYSAKEVHETQSHQKEKATQERETDGREPQPGYGTRAGNWQQSGHESGRQPAAGASRYSGF